MRLLLWRTQSVGHTKVQSNKNNNEIKRMNPNKKEDRERDAKETKGKGSEMNRFSFGIIMSFISEFFFYFLHF